MASSSASDWHLSPLKGQQAAAPAQCHQQSRIPRTMLLPTMRCEVLAALPGNETAFQQVTPQPLPNTGTATSNRRLGPDNPASFPLDASLRVYVDIEWMAALPTLTSIARGHRSRTGKNRGPLGLSSPPIDLDLTLRPPRTLVITRVLAGDADVSRPGDGKITLRWASNREPDLSSDPNPSRNGTTWRPVRDIRLMDLVHEMAVAAGDPAARPAEVSWTDVVPGALVTYSYRLVAVETVGQSFARRPGGSTPARSMTAWHCREDRHWLWRGSLWQARPGGNNLAHRRTRSSLQRREIAGPWIDLGQWRAPGTVDIRDPI